MTVMQKAICSYLYSSFNHTVCLFVSLTFLLLYLFLLCSIKCLELSFLATPTDLGTFPYFAESTLDVLGCMAFSIPIAKDELNQKNP